MRNEFRVPCNTGTYSDTLTALGLAKLLRALGGDDIRIQRPSDSSYYLVTSKRDIADATNATFQSLFPRIVEKSKATKGDDIDYDAEKAKRTRFFEWRKKNPKVKISELPEGVEIELPHPDFILMSSIVDSSANATYSKTKEILEHGKVFGAYIEAAFEGYTNFNGIPEQIDEFLAKTIAKKPLRETSGVQIFNPMAGKGMNSLKPDDVGLDGIKMPIPIEMLKFSGWWLGTVAAKPIISSDPRNNEDLKVFVVAPCDITDSILESIMKSFRDTFRRGGAVQTDIFASLYLTESLLNHHGAVPKIRGRPSRVISGLNSAYFKKTSQFARSVTNLSFIGLPDWLEVQNDIDRMFCLEVLKEHQRILRNLDETHSEAHNLLEKYRDFLSLNSLEIFLEFLVDYGVFALRMLDQSKSDFDKPRWFSTNYLRRVFMGLENGERQLGEILDNSGFQNLAGAIRRSTRNALYAKISKVKRADDYKYEVRYGLAQDLKRKAMYKNEFAAALGKFISEYMAENYRAAERGKRQRPAVTTTDLEQVIALMDTHDSKTVAMLLIAYGYAKEPTEPKVDEPDDTNREQTEGENDQ